MAFICSEYRHGKRKCLFEMKSQADAVGAYLTDVNVSYKRFLKEEENKKEKEKKGLKAIRTVYMLNQQTSPKLAILTKLFLSGIRDLDDV